MLHESPVYRHSVSALLIGVGLPSGHALEDTIDCFSRTRLALASPIHHHPIRICTAFLQFLFILPFGKRHSPAQVLSKAFLRPVRD